MIISESKIVATLKPGPGNPRNSEGAFIRLDDGRLAFVFSRYTGRSDHDHAKCTVCAIYSQDEGETWDTENPELLVDAAQYGEENVMSVSLARMNNGDIGLFFLLKHRGTSSTYMLRRYRGDFGHFLSEVQCFPKGYAEYFVVNNDRVLRLRDGTWIIAAACHHVDGSGQAAPGSEYGYFSERAVVYTFYSRDDGVTWRQNWGQLHLDDSYSRSGLQEPGLLELEGGILYCYSRTDRMYQYESVSLDQGAHWFKPQPSRFSSPSSPMLIKKNPHSGKYYAIWNPVPISVGHPYDRVTAGRWPLVMAQSEDGIRFEAPVALEEDPTRGYCYPALYFLDDRTVLAAYCNGGQDEGLMLDSTAIRRITLGE